MENLIKSIDNTRDSMIKKRRGELSIEIVLTLPKRSPNTIENMNQKIDDFEVERLLYSYDEEEEPGRG